jgi:hypothetical protein
MCFVKHPIRKTDLKEVGSASYKLCIMNDGFVSNGIALKIGRY